MTQTPSPPPAPRRGITSFLAWVWAGLLIGGGAAFLLANVGLLDGLAVEPLLAAGVAALAVPFAARWLARRRDWWAALTAWVFTSLALLILLLWAHLPYGQIVLMAALVLAAVPFAASWFKDRARWWMLLPAYTLVAMAGLLGMTIFITAPATLAAFALLGAALPFWVAYMSNRQQWWPLLPAGALSGIAVVVLATFTLIQPGNEWLFYVALNAALAAVCVAAWLVARRFDWLLWMAVGFVLAGVLAIWFPSAMNWALVALALGVYLVYKQIDASQRQKAVNAPQAGQATASAQPAAPAAPAQAQPSAPSASPAQTSTPPAPKPSGLQIDREATTGHQARQNIPGGSNNMPVVEFRPLDPFKSRREQAQREEEQNGSSGADGEAQQDED